MPALFKEKIFNNLDCLIWEASESESYFLDLLKTNSFEIEKCLSLQGKRKIEWLASRYALQTLLNPQICNIYQDEYGKPHLKDSTQQISISHSDGKVAAIVSDSQCGVDLQLIVDKIVFIKEKFANLNELKSIDPDHHILHLHIYWSAKESLYKAYGKRALDFKEHILLESFDRVNLSGGSFKGKVVKDEIEEYYTIDYRFIDKFVLVNAIRYA